MGQRHGQVLLFAVPVPGRDHQRPTAAFWSHATNVSALSNMLKDRDMLPMNAHGVEKFGCNIF